MINKHYRITKKSEMVKQIKLNNKLVGIEERKNKTLFYYMNSVYTDIDKLVNVLDEVCHICESEESVICKKLICQDCGYKLCVECIDSMKYSNFECQKLTIACPICRRRIGEVSRNEYYRYAIRLLNKFGFGDDFRKCVVTHIRQIFLMRENIQVIHRMFNNLITLVSGTIELEFVDDINLFIPVDMPLHWIDYQCLIIESYE
jgi:hypothetical protein